MNPAAPRDRTQPECLCVQGVCSCTNGIHCHATGCNYVVGIDMGVAIPEPPRVPRKKKEPNIPHERNLAKQRRREAFGKQRRP